jgi:hypothetical protein
MMTLSIIRMIAMIPTLIMQMYALYAAMGPIGLIFGAIAGAGALGMGVAGGGMGGMGGMGMGAGVAAPAMQAGGMVTSTGLAVVHAGEMVTPATTAEGVALPEAGAGGTTTVQITGNTFHFNYKTDVADAMNEIANQARLQLRTMTPQ